MAITGSTVKVEIAFDGQVSDQQDVDELAVEIMAKIEGADDVCVVNENGDIGRATGTRENVNRLS